MNWVKKTTIPIYGTNLYLAVAESVEAASRLLPEKKFPEIGREDFTNCPAAVIRCEETLSIALLFERHGINYENLHHEIPHAAGRVFMLIEQDGLNHSSEVFSYLSGYLGNWACRTLIKNGETIK